MMTEQIDDQTNMMLDGVLFAIFTEPLVIVRPDGTIEKANPQFEQLLGWSSSDIIGTSFYVFVAAELRLGVQEFLATSAALSSGRVNQHTVRLRYGIHQDYRVILFALPVEVEGHRRLLLRLHQIDSNMSSASAPQSHHPDQQPTASFRHSEASNSRFRQDFERAVHALLNYLDVIIPYDVIDVMFVSEGQAYIVHSRGQTTAMRQGHMDDLAMPIVHYTTLSTMMERKRALLISDVNDSEVWNHHLDHLLKEVQSYLGMPLYYEGDLIGFINLNSFTANTYHPAHIALLEIFTHQITISIEHQQRSIQHDEQLTEMEIYLRNIMTMYELGNTLTSTFDLEEIYTSLYERVIRRILDFQDVRVVLIDQDPNVLRQHFVVLDSVIQQKSAHLFAEVDPASEVLYRQLIRDGTPLWKNDYFYIPMLTSKRGVGILRLGTVSEAEVEQVDFIPLMIGVKMAAIAIENAQLYQTIQGQHNEISNLYHATTVLFNSQDVENLAQQVVDTITYGLNQQDCSLLLIDESGQNLLHIAHSSLVPFEKIDVLPLNEPGISVCCARTGRSQYVADVSQNVDYRVSDARVRSEFVIPLQTNRHLFGVLDLQSDQIDGISEKDQHLLLAFASRVSTVFDNLLLTEELRAYANRLEETVEQRTQELRDALVAERRLSETKSRFVMTVSHQFRTPLTAIQSSKELLQNYADRMPAEQRQQRFETIDKAVRDIVGILDDTITFNTLAEGRVEFNPTTLDLNEFTQSLVYDFSARSPKTHEIVYASDAKEAVTIVDIEMWRKVVEELLTNARKFSAPQSEIHCSFRSTASHFEFEVQDAGLGIPADDLDRIFGIYDRAANVDNIPGAGLGLAIVKQLMERHRGSVQLESELGVGTIVKLNLPRYIGELEQ